MCICMVLEPFPINNLKNQLKLKLQIDQFKIKISTKDYIIAHDPTGDVQFDLENEGYITSIAGINISLVWTSSST